MREIITDWVTPGTSTAATVMYWRESPPTAADQREALNDFWTAINSRISSAVTWTIRTEGRLLDEETGTLTGAWSETTPYTLGGGGGSIAVADATQALLRWDTSTIHDGRFIRGRSFVPGLSSAQLSGGNLVAAAITQFEAAQEALILTGTGIGVWARPKPGVPGRWAGVGSGRTWSEFAVLRRRRG